MASRGDSGRPGKLQIGDKHATSKQEANAVFLRAARAGALDQVLECIDKDGADIAACNPNGLNALHLASKEGHVNIVTELLERGAFVDAATKKGNTALHIASLAGHDDIVKILVQSGAKVNSQSQTGFTPLYMAAQENHVEVVTYLLEHGANQTLATEDGFTPLSVALQQGHNRVVAVLMENDSRNKVRLPALHVAAKKDDVRAATLLLNNEQNLSKGGSTVNDATKSGFTPLHIAAHYGSHNAARLLLDYGADINFKARNAITPLHVASKWGRLNVVQILVDRNANLECKTRDSLTPLHCAARSGHDQVVDVLLEKGALAAAKTKNGLTPLHMAAQGDHVECARILLFHQAPIDDVTMDYLTPLHVSAHCGNVKMAKLLLDSKCEVNARALNGFTPLHVACKKNRIKVIELLLRYGALIESTTESGLTPLHVAAFMGHTSIISYLLENGAQTETATMRGETALHLAARANQTEVMRLLIRAGAHVDAKAKEQQTPLHISARLGSVEAVQLLLHHGAARDAATKDLYTPLHIAVKEGHEDVVEILLDNGAKHDTITRKGFTPLHIAAKYGNVPIAKILLQKGANPNVEGKNGLMPLHVATHYNNGDVAQLLLDRKANPHAAAKNGYTPLHIAAKRNQVEIAKILLDSGAKPDSESKNGYTPLHLASQEGHTDIAELLLQRGANVHCKSKNLLTPMHLAAQEDQVPIAEILVQYKSEIDHQTKAGYTPLHTACHFGQLNMIRFLLEHGASVHATTKLGYTPLHQAAQQGHVLVINILLKYKASPDSLTTTGQTPLSIAQQLGYISVVEILKNVTTVTVATPTIEEKYKVVIPEMMQEAPIDSDEEAGDETLPADKSYTYLSVDDAKEMRYSSNDPHKGDTDLFGFETMSGRQSTLSSVGGRDPLHDELRYMHGPDESFGGRITPSTGVGTMQDEYKYMTEESEDQRQRQRSQTPSGYDFGEHVDGVFTPSAGDTLDRPAVTPSADDEMKYLWSDDALPVTPAYIKNQLKFGKPAAESTLERRPQLEETPIEALECSRHIGLSSAAPSQYPPLAANVSEMDSQIFGSLYSDASFANSFNPDNIAIERHPVILGFLVSFVVDARGGAMRGCRHSGLRLIVPPGRACAPTRITCKLVKYEKLAYPPPLMDGESLATRILKMGPIGATFSGPVLLEVPHFASLRGKEREVTVLRSDDGHTWREHPIVSTEEAIQKCLSGNFEGEELESAEELYQRRVTRIVTNDFPVYFALVTRIRQELKVVGLNSAIISSTVVPQVQVKFPDGAITKSIRIGLQAHPVSEELVAKMVGDRVSVSPIVTIEPRHRKFHQSIAITIPLPPKSPLRGAKTKPSAGNPTLRLLCSMTGGTSPVQWEDITGASPLTLIDDCVNFTTNISARFWLIDCPNAKEAIGMATELYREAMVVPFISKFVLFAKRRNLTEARLRVFCVTDDKMEKTLESQEHFVEVARSRDVEVLEGRRQFVEVIGNMSPIIKTTTEPLCVSFRPFRENRLPLVVRLRDLKSDPAGQVLFIAEPRGTQGMTTSQPPAPICVLNVVLPGLSAAGGDDDAQTPDLDVGEIQLSEAFKTAATYGPVDQIKRAELRLTDIADALQSDWVPLARQLGLTQHEIIGIQRDFSYVSEQALVVLHLWVEKNKEHATGNELERALKRINREDIIDHCMRNLKVVTDEAEKQQALAFLEADMIPSESNVAAAAESFPATEMAAAPSTYLETTIDDYIAENIPNATKSCPSSEEMTGTEQETLPEAVQLPILRGDEETIEELAPVIAVPELEAATPLSEQQERVSGISMPWSEQSETVLSGTPEFPVSSLPAEVISEVLPSVSVPLEQTNEFPEQSSKHPEVRSEVPASFSLLSEDLESAAEPPVASQETADVIQSVHEFPAATLLSPMDLGTSVAQSTSEMQDIAAFAADTLLSDEEKQPMETVITASPSITKHKLEGEVYMTVEKQDGEEVAEDGNIVRRQVRTQRQLMPVYELTLADGVEVSRTASEDILVGMQIDEFVEVLPPGVDDPYSEGLEAETSVEESEESLPSGGILRRCLRMTIARRLQDAAAVTEPEKIPVVSEPTFSTPIQESAPPAEATYSTEPVVAALPSVAESDLGVTEKLPVEEVTSPAVEPTDSSVWAEQVPPSTSAELQAPVSEEIFDLQEDVDVAPEDEVCGIRVYTDTTAGVPQVETDVQETEEVLPDGTVIRRKVIKTQQRQLISTRVVMEGPEDVLPATKAEAEQFLGEMEVSGELSRRVMSDSEDPQVYTNVEEHEEVLPDGSIVKRRVVTTTRHHVTTEKMALEDEGAFDIPADNGTTPAQGDVGGDHATR